MLMRSFRYHLAVGVIAGLALLSVDGQAGGRELPNLRSQRMPSKAWQLEHGPFQVIVSPRTLKGDAHAARWQLVVEVSRTDGRAWRSLEVTAQGARVIRRPVQSGGRQSLELEVSAPRMCPTARPREAVTLQIEYMAASSRHTALIDVDHRCLLGDTVPLFDAQALAALARGHTHDPVVEHLVENAPPDGASLSTEVDYVKRAIGFNIYSLQTDPRETGRSYSNRTAYVLAPSETARLGGDCDDWTLLMSAYLARRGWNPWIALSVGHVWTSVAASPDEPHRRVTVDLVADQPFAGDPLDQAPVRAD